MDCVCFHLNKERKRKGAIVLPAKNTPLFIIISPRPTSVIRSQVEEEKNKTMGTTHNISSIAAAAFLTPFACSIPSCRQGRFNYKLISRDIESHSSCPPSFICLPASLLLLLYRFPIIIIIIQRCVALLSSSLSSHSL